MEVIELTGYTEEEKLQIGLKHLLQEERKNNGLKEEELKFQEAAMQKLISGYTMEPGVRELARQISKAGRHNAVKLVNNKKITKVVTANNLEDFVGPKKFDRDLVEEGNPPGIVTGMAWSTSGGSILFLEATKFESEKPEVKISGLLGQSMEESVKAALTFVRMNARSFGITTDFEKTSFHIHFPTASQKDGPSAGITIVTALVSLLRNEAVSGDISMTGEISLRGKILPIGGVKEKLLAAIRAGVKKVYIPEENKHDLKELSTDITNKLDIQVCERIEDVLIDIFPKLKAFPTGTPLVSPEADTASMSAAN
jgi:ATP-dependent Lon protease